jgi:hypothetical protein
MLLIAAAVHILVLLCRQILMVPLLLQLQKRVNLLLLANIHDINGVLTGPEVWACPRHM